VTAPLVDLAKLNTLADEELERARVVSMAALSERQRLLVEGKLAGKSTFKAAEAAGYRSANRAGLKALKGRGVAEALAIGRESIRRRSNVTLEDVASGFKALHRAALAAGDLTNANRALEQLARLAGLYPEQRIRLEVTGAPADLARFSDEEWETASRLMHEARKQLPAAGQVVDVEATPVPEEPADAA